LARLPPEMGRGNVLVDKADSITRLNRADGVGNLFLTRSLANPSARFSRVMLSALSTSTLPRPISGGSRANRALLW
jgi:hypothetical protein